MKKHYILFIACCFAALSAWADTSINENFTQIGTVNTTNSANGIVRSGDVCAWQLTDVRWNGSNDKIKVDEETTINAMWLSLSTGGAGTIATTNLEGGIKKVEFKYARFGSEYNEEANPPVTGRSLQLTVSAGASELSTSFYDNNNLTSRTAGYKTFTGDFAVKSNVQLSITNTSTYTETLTNAGICRINVGDISITPYLLYRNKEITIGSKQRGFVNKDLIDNTEGEGTITYSSSNENVARVDGDGVITPVASGDAVITASWSAGASTTYKLHVVDGIIVESFTKIGEVSSVVTGKADSWKGDLYSWNVRSTRRGVNDTIGLNPRIQAVWIQKNTTENSYIETPTAFDGGLKHVAFRWRQWATETGTLKLALYAAGTTGGWGSALYNDEHAAETANTEFNFEADVDDGTHNYVKLKLSNESSGSTKTHRIVIENIKITPWLLYTTKEATLDTRGSGALTYTNPDLIDNTGSTVTYTIEDYDGIPTDKIEINSSGTITVADRYQSGDITVQAKWSEVTTTYTLHVVGKASANAHFTNEEENKTLLDIMFNNPVIKEAGSGDATYSSDNTDVATVDGANVTIKGVGDATITATIAENDNFQGAVVSYTLHVAAPNFFVAGDFTEWATNKIPVYADSYTKNLAAGSHELKVIDGETWKGFSDLTASEMIAGLYGNNDNNVCFTLAESGNVTITYDGEVFKVAGNLVPQVIKVKGEWDEWAEHTAELSDDKKSASVILPSLSVAENVQFGVLYNGEFRANGHTFTRDNHSTTNITGNTGNMKLTSDKAGNYTFTWTFGTNGLDITFPDSPTGVDNTEASVKAVKRLENGMLIIEKNGVRYNVLGAKL